MYIGVEIAVNWPSILTNGNLLIKLLRTSIQKTSLTEIGTNHIPCNFMMQRTAEAYVGKQLLASICWQGLARVNKG